MDPDIILKSPSAINRLTEPWSTWVNFCCRKFRKAVIDFHGTTHGSHPLGGYLLSLLTKGLSISGSWKAKLLPQMPPWEHPSRRSIFLLIPLAPSPIQLWPAQGQELLNLVVPNVAPRSTCKKSMFERSKLGAFAKWSGVRVSQNFTVLTFEWLKGSFHFMSEETDTQMVACLRTHTVSITEIQDFPETLPSLNWQAYALLCLLRVFLQSSLWNASEQKLNSFFLPCPNVWL